MIVFVRGCAVEIEDMIVGGTECPSCTSGVTEVTCKFGPVGLGEGLNVSWTLPDECECTSNTDIKIDGETVVTVPPDRTTAGILGSRLPDGVFSVEVVNCSGLVGSCSPFNTTADGLIITQAFLALGPISTAINCAGSPDDLLGNHIAPSFIGCEYPSLGDETVQGVDFTDPDNVANGFHPDTVETWRQFDDGTPTNGDQDMDAEATGDLSDHMTWLVTYVEYLGDPAEITLCIGSDDDVQVWMNDQLVHNNNSCRPRGVCNDNVIVSIEPGVYRIAMAVWENGGGWGGSIGIQDEAPLSVAAGPPDH